MALKSISLPKACVQVRSNPLNSEKIVALSWEVVVIFNNDKSRNFRIHEQGTIFLCPKDDFWISSTTLSDRS